MLAWYRRLRMTPKIVLPVTVLLVVILGFLTWQIQSKSSQAIEDVAKRELAALGAQNGNYVRSYLNTALSAAAALADGLEQTLKKGVPPSRETLIAMEEGVHMGNPDIFGCVIMWEPNAFDGKDAEYKGVPGSNAEGRFLSYSSTGADVTDLNDQLAQSYYTVPKKTLAPYLSNPYPFPVEGKEVDMSTAAYPVIVDNVFRGVAVVDMSLEKLDKLITNIAVYESGYAGLLNDQGLVVAHKDKSLEKKNLFEINRFNNPEKVREAFASGKPYVEEVDTKEGRVFRYYQPIPVRGSSQHWYLAVIAPMDEVLAQANAISRMTVALCVATLVVLLVVIFLLIRSSVKPINYLARTAEIIADGNLEQPIEDERFGGEVKMLSTSLKKMIASLIEGIKKAEALSISAQEESQKAREAMTQAEAASKEAQSKTQAMLVAADKLEEVGNVVSSASSELSAQIEQSDRGAAESAQRLSEAATAMNEMNATVQEVAKNASSASAASADTKEKAQAGAQVVEKAVRSIEQVHQMSLELKGDMTQLNEHAQDITRIMGVISDIADQTNLLALNAAIEAARAGEAGRGFAVVADEVRKLAEKTMASTNDVGNAIKAIQESTAKSMVGVDNAVERIGEATELAGRSGEALQEIVATVEITADQVNAIATASEEQSAASEEINQSIVQVNDMSRQTAEAMAEAARAVSDLAAQAQGLTELIEAMKKG